MDEEQHKYDNNYCWNCEHYTCRWCKEKNESREPEDTCTDFKEM